MRAVILVVLERPEVAAALLNAASCLAELADGARINVLSVHEPPPTAPLRAEMLMEEAAADLAADQPSRAAALKTLFDAWIAGDSAAGAAAHWVAAEGSAAGIVEERGRRADFVVVAQPAADEDRTARRAFHAALFQTERPVLVVPAGSHGRFGRRVAIAWRDDEPTIKAVLPTLNLLARAEQIHLITGTREAAARPSIPKALTEHGIGAELHVLRIGSGPFGKDLLTKAHDVGADMLIMGAYAHSPLRELILGGVTSYMLAHADLKLLMRH